MNDGMRRIDEIIAQLESNCDSQEELKRCVAELARHVKNWESTLWSVKNAWEYAEKLRRYDERQQQLFKDVA